MVETLVPMRFVINLLDRTLNNLIITIIILLSKRRNHLFHHPFCRNTTAQAWLVVVVLLDKVQLFQTQSLLFTLRPKFSRLKCKHWVVFQTTTTITTMINLTTITIIQLAVRMAVILESSCLISLRVSTRSHRDTSLLYNRRVKVIPL